MKKYLILALVAGVVFFAVFQFAGCEKGCDDDPDCIKTPGGWEEIDVQDGHCECA